MIEKFLELKIWKKFVKLKWGKSNQKSDWTLVFEASFLNRPEFKIEQQTLTKSERQRRPCQSSAFSHSPFDPTRLWNYSLAGLEVKVSSSTFSLGLVSNFCVTSVSSHWNTKHLPHSTRCPSLSRFCKLNLSMNWPSSAPSQRPSRLWWASRTPRTKKSASKSRPLRPSGTALSQTPESSIPNRRSKLQVMTSTQSKLWTFFVKWVNKTFITRAWNSEIDTVKSD